MANAANRFIKIAMCGVYGIFFLNHSCHNAKYVVPVGTKQSSLRQTSVSIKLELWQLFLEIILQFHHIWYGKSVLELDRYISVDIR